MERERQVPRRRIDHVEAIVETASKPPPAFIDNRPKAIAQRNLADALRNSPRAITQRAVTSEIHHGPGAMAESDLALSSHSGSESVAQRTLIPGTTINVYVDNAGYAYWQQGSVKWHLTMKDASRWHITTEDRSASYWFEVNGGTVRSVKPTKNEFGSHKDKHHALDDAPSDVANFIRNHIYEIITVNEKEPK